MGMTGSGDIFAVRMKFHGETDLADELAHLRADHVHAENAVVVGAGDDLYEAFALVLQLSPAVRRKRKPPDLVGMAARLYLLLGQSDPRYFGARVDHAGDDVVVDMAGEPCQRFDAGDAFVLGLMRQHRTNGHIADGPETRYRCRKVLSWNEAAVVRLQVHCLEAKVADKGPTADRYQDHIRFDRGFDAVLEALYLDRDAGVVRSCLKHLCGQPKRDALLLEHFLTGRCDCRVRSGNDVIEEFNNFHLGAEAAPDRAGLKADAARAD